MSDEVADSELLARAQAGSMEAFEALVERHRDRVFTLARRMLRSEADAAEVTQDTFLNAFRKLGDFRQEAGFGSWVYRIAANFALMRLRRRRVASGEAPPEPAFNERGSLVEEVADWSRNAEGLVLDAELARAIETAADALPDEHREVFVLRDLEGLSYEEISEVTGQSVPSVKSRLHRARLSMRSAIDQFYQDE